MRINNGDFYVALGSSKNFALLVWVGSGLLKQSLYIFDNEPRSGQKSPILHLPQEFVLGQLSVQHCRASYHSRSTEPVIFYRTSDCSMSTGQVIGPDLQGQCSAHFYKASDRSMSTGPVIGPDLQSQ